MPAGIGKILPHLAAITAMAAVTAAFLPFRDLIDGRPATVAFAQLLIVLLAAARWGAGPALAAALLGFVAFDLVYLAPAYGWTIEHPADGVLMLAIVATSLAVGQMAARARRRAGEAEATRREIERLCVALRDENAERQRSEEELRESEVRYRGLMESAPDALVIVDENGRIRLVNSQTEALFGYARNELAGLPVEILVPAALRQRHGEQRRAYMAQPRIRHAGSGLELFGQRKDGSCFPVDIALSPLRLKEGLLVTAAVRDMTEVRLLEGERLARQSAEAANRAKSRFLADISHNLRSPLNTILGFTRLLVRTPDLPASLREDLELVLKNSEHLHELINDILDLSRLEAGQVALEEADFDLDRLGEDLQARFGPAAGAKGLQLLFSRHPDMPRHVRNDPVMLRKVLTHLLDNALEYTLAGQVAVSVETKVAAGEPQRMVFTVADSGPGIAPEELPRLFEPFARPRAERTAPVGSGLGLAICRGLVQVMGGELQVDSAAGRGTTIRFDLPLRIAAGIVADAADRRREVIGLAPGQPHYRILAVDDYAAGRRLLVRLLAPLGFEVREAANGQEAVELWRQWQPDLIWMDIRMPVLDGREATRRIRAIAPGPRPVIIALTASSFEGKRDELLAAGCDDFLKKPYAEAELLALIEKHLGVRFVYRDEAAAAAPAEPAAAAVAALPKALRQELEQALLGLDAPAVDQAIATIWEHDVDLGEALVALARDFQYDRILRVIESAARSGNGRPG